MCRYACHTYKNHFVCFACRKAFKKTAFEDYVEHKGLRADMQKAIAARRYRNTRLKPSKVTLDPEQVRADYLHEVSRCPQCGGQMASMGLDLRPPPQRNREAWEILQAMYEHGFAFRGCGCMVGYAPPARRSELAGWLQEHERRSDGQKLLASITRRKRGKTRA